MDFVGRTAELGVLNEAYRSDGYEGIVVYGRRRIGKSELIKESFKTIDAGHLYFECVDASEETNARFLSEKIAETFHIPVPSFRSIRECLLYFFDRSLSQKMILVLDEYPFLRKNNPSMDSILQTVVDEYKTRCQLKFILCGSYVAVMEELLTSKNPLYGRFSIKINVRQMDYLDAAKFYPHLSDEDKVAIYSVFGGIPYYNQFVDDTLSVKENIIRLVASERSRLLTEARDFVAMEINKMSNANETFIAIAEGYRKFSDILSHSRVSASPTLADVLKKLEGMDAISKSSPINDKSQKKTIYEISDRLTHFYYRYLFRRLSFFHTMKSDDFYEEFIREDFLTHYVPKEFERIGAQYLIRKNKEGRIRPPLYKVGKYYYDDPKSKTNGEFDLVTLSKDGYDFYEAKFSHRPIDDAVVNEERHQLSQIGIPYHRLGFVSKSGFRLCDPSGLILISLEDMYRDESLS